MVKVNRKFVALLLMSIMLVSMVAFSASAYQGVAATSGGNLNIWVEKTLKGGKIATVANGTNLGEIEDLGKGVGYAHKYGGYVRLSYVAKVVKPAATAAPGTPAAPVDTPLAPFNAKAATTGGKLNVWEKKNFTGAKLLTVDNNTVLGVVTPYKEGYATIVVNGTTGYVRTKYLAKVVAPKPVDLEPADVAMVQVVGTAKDSVIYIWKDMTKKDGSKKGAYQKVAVGTVFENVVKYNNGWTKVEFKDADGKPQVGYIMTKYTQKYAEPVDPVLTSKEVTKVKVVGTAPNSVINLWKGYTKEGGSKKVAYGPVALGTVFEGVTMWSDGWTDVEIELADGTTTHAHIDSKYIQVVTP